jgi:hypothetical protein
VGWLILLVIVVLIGALLGGESFGGTIRKGCGFLFLVGIGLIVLSLFTCPRLNMDDAGETDTKYQVPASSERFLVQQSSPLYSKPDVQSDTMAVLRIGDEVVVPDPDRYTYFYWMHTAAGLDGYVRKDCLKKVY